MNENEIAPAVHHVTLDVDPDEFYDAIANCADFTPTNVVRNDAVPAFAVEFTFDANDAALDAYLAYFDLPRDERDDIFNL